jgi:hypothetical protein
MVGILTPKEYRAIYNLSRAYVAEHSVASKKGAKPPYVKVEPKEAKDEVVRKMVETKVEDVFASMLSAQKRE